MIIISIEKWLHTKKGTVKMAEEKKEIRQVATGHIKEKGVGDKIADAFLSEDTRTVKNYILWDVFIPGIKNAIADVIIGGLEMAFFGSSRGRRSSGSRGGDSRVSYQWYYRDNNRSYSTDRVDRHYRSSRNGYNDIYLESRDEAEEVRISMEELVNKYGEATVADLYSLVGMTSTPQDNKWGWRDVRDFSFARSRGGYVTDFNAPLYLD